MKLRNKKTGEINLGDLHLDDFDSLAELNAEWEDYEEPKEYWYIGDSGDVWSFSHYYLDTEIEETHREIGNFFETKEEAEKAVEMLKAWKRLKDKGFEFKGINMNDGSIKTGLSKGVSLNDCEEFYEDMTLLFGGEE